MPLEHHELRRAEATAGAAVLARVLSLHVLVHGVRTGGPVDKGAVANPFVGLS